MQIELTDLYEHDRKRGKPTTFDDLLNKVYGKRVPSNVKTALNCNI